MFFSAQEDTTAFAGGQYGLVHFDEQIPEEFFSEALQRTMTVKDSGMIVTETPLGGKGFWTHTILTRDALAKRTIGSSKRLLVSLHTCSQYDTGLYAAEEIDSRRALMSEQEAEARIFGRPAAYSKTHVFDRFQISEMFDGVREPRRGQLRVHAVDPAEQREDNRHQEKANGENTEELLAQATDDTSLVFLDDAESELRVWEEPETLGQYVIGADVAEGMTNNDASCAQVLKMEHRGNSLYLTHVASWHGWINSIVYAYELFKLSLWYNCALLVPERRGPGDATIQKLKELGCWTLFRDVTDPAFAIPGQDPRLGLDTNVKTKPLFIACLQNAIWSRRTRTRSFVTYDRDTLEELGSYGQERSDSGQTVKFRGESGTPDDRVMGLGLGAYPALTSYAFDPMLGQEAKRAEAAGKKNLDSQEEAFWDRVREDQAARKARERVI